MKRTSDDPAAPFGYGPDGDPLAPFGLKVNGEPRLSNRGARAGQVGNAGPAGPARGSSGPGAPRAGSANRARRDTLISLSNAFLTPSLVGISITPAVHRIIGPEQAMALAGDAVVINAYMPQFADALVTAAEVRPGLLAWLDNVDDKAPFIALLAVGVQVGKAIVANHLQPDPRLGNAGIALMQMTAMQMAADIEAQAAAMGINVPTGQGDEDQGDEGDQDQERAA